MNHDTDDKPLGASLGWERLETARLFQSHWHNLRQDRVRVPNGQEITYTYQEDPGFVVIVPATGDGQIVMIRSYRYTVDDWCWELPAGGLGDHPGLSLAEVARLELAEETGGDCVEMRQIGWFYSLNGTADARCTIFLATSVELNGRPRLEAAEQSEVHLIPVVQALQMARDGRISDGDSALALLRCEVHLAGRNRRIEIVPHDPGWAQAFEAEAARLREAFGEELLAIHHMGSTAVPGLPAKPIIDMLPEVRDIDAIDDLNDAMVALGYTPKGENGIPGRRFFSKDLDGVRRFHLHVFQTGDPEIARHLDFIDYLKAHPAAARAYANLKQRLAREHATDISRYTDGKGEFIRGIDDRANAWKKSNVLVLLNSVD